MIPKTIHYCWFGGNPLPKLAKKCIKSWKKYCKDYEIIQWNEKTFDIKSAPLYVRQAYDAKKWAFVTDYVRLYAMVKYGGVYMDTDVEVIKPLDAFLNHKAFSGFENDTQIPTGIMACEKDFPLFERLLRYYDNASFFNEDGTMNCTTNVAIITQTCLEYGLKQNNTFQIIDGFALYPKDYFCPIEWSTLIKKETENTATIHHFSGSWHTKSEKNTHKQQIKKQRRIERIHKIKHLPNSILMKILGDSLYEKIKKKIKK